MNEIEIAKVMFHRDDFGICRTAIIHAEEYFKIAIDEEEARPDGWTAKDCENIIKNLQMVKTKIDIVLGMEYNKVSQETWDSLEKDLKEGEDGNE